MMRTILIAKNVRKTYNKGKTIALHDISLDLKQGEILALLGPNGAGKTTFIKILATLLIKDSGSVNILGFDLDKEEEKIKHTLGYVGQDTERSAYARLTARENLHFFGSLRGMSKKLIDEKINYLGDYFDLNSSLDKLFMELSGGQKQLIVIIRAILHDPPIIFLDEPTKGLDPIIAKKIRGFLVNYTKKESKSLILTSHILTEVDEMADRVALIKDGKIHITGTPEELKRSVGAVEFIELRKDDIPEKSLKKLLNLEEVVNIVDRDENWLSFGLSNILEGTEAVIKFLRQEKINTTGFRHHTVSLEDAFIHHVGTAGEKFEA